MDGTTTPIEQVAYFLVLMVGAAINPKALGLSIVSAFILDATFPDQELAITLITAYVGLNIVAGFRN